MEMWCGSICGRMGDASLIGLCVPGAAWQCNHACLDGGWPRRAVDFAMTRLDEGLYSVDLLFAVGVPVQLVSLLMPAWSAMCRRAW